MGKFALKMTHLTNELSPVEPRAARQDRSESIEKRSKNGRGNGQGNGRKAAENGQISVGKPPKNGRKLLGDRTVAFRLAVPCRLALRTKYTPQVQKRSETFSRKRSVENGQESHRPKYIVRHTRTEPLRVKTYQNSVEIWSKTDQSQSENGRKVSRKRACPIFEDFVIRSVDGPSITHRPSA